MLDYSVIITAGGTGKRMGAPIPKQFMEVAGKPMLFHTISLFHHHNPNAQILITLPESWIDHWSELVNTYQFDVEHEVIAGGKERFHSIQNALHQCQESIVLVHDGVRPLVSSETLNRCLAAMETHNAVVPVVPVKESLRRSMKVTDHIKASKDTLFSFEILPPLKGKSIQSIYDGIDPLMEFKPKFVNVTYHREEFIYKERENGLLEKIAIRKRPGTVGICAAIMNKYDVDAVPHLICGGFSKEETENALIDLQFLGIDNEKRELVCQSFRD